MTRLRMAFFRYFLHRLPDPSLYRQTATTPAKNHLFRPCRRSLRFLTRRQTLRSPTKRRRDGDLYMARNSITRPWNNTERSARKILTTRFT